MTDAPKSNELERLEKLYKDELQKRPVTEAERAEQRMQLQNIAWSIDKERGLPTRRSSPAQWDGWLKTGVLS